MSHTEAILEILRKAEAQKLEDERQRLESLPLIRITKSHATIARSAALLEAAEQTQRDAEAAIARRHEKEQKRA